MNINEFVITASKQQSHITTASLANTERPSDSKSYLRSILVNSFVHETVQSSAVTKLLAPLLVLVSVCSFIGFHVFNLFSGGVTITPPQGAHSILRT
jgi:hypothetical protein